MNANRLIKKITDELEVVQIGDEHLADWAFATHNMFRKTLGIKFELAGDFLDRLMESSQAYKDKLFILAVTKNNLIRGTGSVVRVYDESDPAIAQVFYDYGFTDEDVVAFKPTHIFLLTRLVLDIQGLTVEERWQGLRAMKIAVFSHCFSKGGSVVVGLPDAPRMTKFYARQGIKWRILAPPTPFPGIKGYETSKCLLTVNDLSDSVLNELELEPESDGSSIKRISTGSV